MEVVPNPSRPGKFQVLLGGVAIPCYHDTQCPGAAVCAINQTWGAGPEGNCMCVTRGGNGGKNCDEICGENGVMILLISLCIIMISLLSSGFGSYALFQLWKYKEERKINPVTMVLLTSTFGSWFYFFYICCSLSMSIGFSSFYAVIPDPRGSGRILKVIPQTLDTSVNVFLGLGTCIGLDALIFLPLYWWDLARRVVKLRQNATTALYTISSLCILLVTGVQFPLFIIAVASYRELILLIGPMVNKIWNAPLSLIIFLDLLAIWKMHQLRMFRRGLNKDFSLVTVADQGTTTTTAPASRDSPDNKNKHISAVSVNVSSSAGDENNTPPSINKHISTASHHNANRHSQRVADKFDTIITRIQITAAVSCLLSAGMIAALLYSNVRLARTLVNDPSCNVAGNPFAESDFALRFTILLMQIAMSVTIWFVYQGARNKIIAAKTKFASSAVSSAGNNNNNNNNNVVVVGS
jgi:hypothetical protein